MANRKVPLSEQLKPRCDASLEKIPSLRQIDRLAAGSHHLLPSRLNEHQDEDTADLKARLAELELVNNLLRSRVNQLECSEASIRESEIMLRHRLQETEDRNKKLMRKIRNIFSDETDDADDITNLGDYERHAVKKAKLSI